MTKNIKFGEPPTLKVLKEDVGALLKYVAELDRWARTIHQTIYGLGGSGGELDGIDNITSAEDPGEADGTLASATEVLNKLVTNLEATGIVA